MTETRTADTHSPSLWPLATATLFAAALLASQVRAETTVSHAFSNFGEPIYGADMAHLNYVNPEAPKGGEFSTWAQGGFDSFNRYSRKGVAGTGLGLMTESIVTSTADDPYGIYCYLCTTMEYPESLDWVIFNLRDDVTFADGTPMTAADVEFSFNLFLEQGIAEYRNAYAGFIEQVEVLGPHQIKFTFTAEASRRDVISFAGGTVVFSKAWFEETGARLDESTLTPFMATGPYVVESFEAGRQIVYGRNPHYWGAEHPMNVGQNNFDRIRFEYFADSTASLEAFKAGVYTFRNEYSSKDWATSYDFPALEKGWVTRRSLPNGTIGSAQSWIFNLRRPEWQDPKVREALRLMFNFEWSNETLFYGLYERVNSFWENSELEAMGVPTPEEVAILKPLVDEGLLPEAILTDEPVMSPTSGTRKLDRKNLRRASALLDEAGWIVGDDGLRRKDGKPLEAVILSYSPAFDRIINPLIENMERLGVQASLERVDVSQYVDRRRTGDYDLVNHTFSMGYEPGNGLKQWYASETADDSSRNLMGLKNPAVDRLIDVVVAAQTLEELKTATHTLDRVLRAEGFWIPQWFKNVHTIAYYDMMKHPENMPPFALGEMSFWWYDAARAEELKAEGAL